MWDLRCNARSRLIRVKGEVQMMAMTKTQMKMMKPMAMKMMKPMATTTVVVKGRIQGCHLLGRQHVLSIRGVDDPYRKALPPLSAGPDVPWSQKSGACGSTDGAACQRGQRSHLEGKALIQMLRRPSRWGWTIQTCPCPKITMALDHQSHSAAVDSWTARARRRL